MLYMLLHFSCQLLHKVYPHGLADFHCLILFAHGFVWSTFQSRRKKRRFCDCHSCLCICEMDDDYRSNELPRRSTDSVGRGGTRGRAFRGCKVCCFDRVIHQDSAMKAASMSVIVSGFTTVNHSPAGGLPGFEVESSESPRLASRIKLGIDSKRSCVSFYQTSCINSGLLQPLETQCIRRGTTR